MQCLVVKQEMDTYAGRKETEVHVDCSVLEDPFEDESQPSEPETTGEPQGQAGIFFTLVSSGNLGNI